MTYTQDPVDQVVYSKFKQYSQEEVAEAYRSLFDLEVGTAASIVLADLIQFSGYGAEGFHVDDHQSAFTQGVKVVVQHIKNNLNRREYMDAEPEIVDLGEE